MNESTGGVEESVLIKVKVKPRTPMFYRDSCATDMDRERLVHKPISSSSNVYDGVSKCDSTEAESDWRMIYAEWMASVAASLLLLDPCCN